MINQKITKKVLDMISEISKWDYVDEDEFEEDEEESEDETLSEQQIEEKREKAKAEHLKKNKERYENFYN